MAEKINNSQRFVRDVIARWSVGSYIAPLNMKSDVLENSALRLAKWEKMAIDSKHDYSKETFKDLLDEETKQETP